MGNIPETLDDLAEVADEEAEEIGKGRDEIDTQETSNCGYSR